MQVNHPVDRVLIVPGAEDLMRGFRSYALQLSLIVSDLALELVDLRLRATFVSQFEDFVVKTRDVVSYSLFFFLSTLEELIVLLILAWLPLHERFD